ncbi:putative fluoride ion transporter CrcB [Salinimicrobium marinum]|uniref:Fluoride-specific ion channel FluC n=1 Tax=Salinimicrobium marinum TaxID=680283 RepID=A0A918S863_9FLAO|nr:fluoride efflux transporter CrcB [Salinimicrobium marinum]GHA28254.1 putative fluoride ion transporter CrcB [Salinimicrobium marinum]
MVKNALLVFLGGGLGSVLRYIISKYLNNLHFPFGTFTVNILGSLLLGFILGFALKNQNLSGPVNLLFGIGFCGGFTTFSTFAVENQVFLRSGDYFTFALYAFGSILLGVLAVFLGLSLSKFF